MLTSLLVLDMVLELDLRLPSQSREIERLLCLCFFDTGGLGGRGVLTRLASGENWPREVSTYITAPIFWDMERA